MDEVLKLEASQLKTDYCTQNIFWIFSSAKRHRVISALIRLLQKAILCSNDNSNITGDFILYLPKPFDEYSFRFRLLKTFHT